MHWRLKATAQKLLGMAPFGESLHYHLQRRFGGLRDFSRECRVKVSDWKLMAGHLRDAGRPIAGARLLEIGSGWYPTFPFLCWIAGAREIVTVDLTRHMRPELTRDCAAELGKLVAEIAAAAQLDEATVRERQSRLLAALERGADVGAATDGAIRYLAPSDARRTGLPDASIDCVFSNSVLEHVPMDVIRGMYTESMRILVPGGVMFHSVNCGDHYAYVDRNISQLNYLRYSDAQWQRWNNAFLYQNRVRAHRFVDEAREAGFAIVLDTAKPHPTRLQQLAQVPVHPQFAHMPPEVLAITSVDFIARKPAAA